MPNASLSCRVIKPACAIGSLIKSLRIFENIQAPSMLRVRTLTTSLRGKNNYSNFDLCTAYEYQSSGRESYRLFQRQYEAKLASVNTVSERSDS